MYYSSNIIKNRLSSGIAQFMSFDVRLHLKILIQNFFFLIYIYYINMINIFISKLKSQKKIFETRSQSFEDSFQKFF